MFGKCINGSSKINYLVHTRNSRAFSAPVFSVSWTYVPQNLSFKENQNNLVTVYEFVTKRMFDKTYVFKPMKFSRYKPWQIQKSVARTESTRIKLTNTHWQYRNHTQMNKYICNPWNQTKLNHWLALTISINSRWSTTQSHSNYSFINNGLKYLTMWDTDIQMIWNLDHIF